MKNILNIKLDKKKKIILIFFLLIVAMIVYFLPEKSNIEQAEGISNNTESITDEKRLEEVLSNVHGVGRVSVMITYENSSEVVCADNIERQTNTVTEKTQSGTKESETVIESRSPVTIGTQDENALVVVEKEPKIKGVIVVAQGAENVSVKMELQKAVETVLQISPSQVEIFAMN